MPLRGSVDCDPNDVNLGEGARVWAIQPAVVYECGVGIVGEGKDVNLAVRVSASLDDAGVVVEGAVDEIGVLPQRISHVVNRIVHTVA